MSISSIVHDTLNHEDFDTEINVHGLDIQLRPGIACPCISRETGQPDPGCSQCQGWGRLWSTAVAMRAYGPNRLIRRQYYEPGQLDIGDAEFTFPTSSFVGHLDRFKVPSETIVYSESFVKGLTNPLTGASKEQSRFETIEVVERAVWSKRSGPGFPYSYGLFELRNGVDFSIVNGNQVSWLQGGSPPEEGAHYVIRFRTSAEYLVWSVQGRAEGSQQMPVKYLCKRLDFIKRP